MTINNRFLTATPDANGVLVIDPNGSIKIDIIDNFVGEDQTKSSAIRFYGVIQAYVIYGVGGTKAVSLTNMNPFTPIIEASLNNILNYL